MDSQIIELVIGLGITLLLLSLGFGIGGLVERRHYASIRRRENELRDILLIPIRTPPASLGECKSDFVCGSVVIGMDYFKMFMAGLRNFIGGRVSSYETLFERARREAILRMKEEARKRHAKYVFNVKFSTANVMSGEGKKTGGCVEVIAYGTALIP